MELNERLELALHDRGMSIREFHRRMQERAVPGSSYPAIHRVLKGETNPSLEFLKAAAELLDVNPAWLILGQGPATGPQASPVPDPREAIRRRMQALFDPTMQEEYSRLLEEEVRKRRDEERAEESLAQERAQAFTDLIGTLVEGEHPDVAHRRRAALSRFSRKIDDLALATGSATWDIGTRVVLLVRAATFLREVDEAFLRAAREDAADTTPLIGEFRFGSTPVPVNGQLIVEPESEGLWLTWYDAALDLFSRRVFGVGVRTGSIDDPHERVRR